MTATTDTGAQRYTAVAIVLHWAIAFAIAFMIPLGFWMHEAVKHTDTIRAATAAFQLHKSIGLTVLALSLIRLGWRLAHRAPPLPAKMPAWEKFAAKATHWLFYVLIIGLPLTGWLYVSTGWQIEADQPFYVATHWFKLFPVPPLFDLPHAPEATRRALAFATMRTHWALAWTTVGLAALHVAAALKHQFADRDEVMAHMVPGLKTAPALQTAQASAGRNAVLGLGFAAIALCVAALAYALLTLAPPAAAATPAQAHSTPSHAAASTPASWSIVPASSAIHFTASVTSEGNVRQINGQFTSWQATIAFDPANLAHSAAHVVINTGSARDGVPFDETYLPNVDFFNTAHFPTAVFQSTSMSRSGAGYQAVGTLTIKGHAIPVTMPFTVTITGNHAVMDGHFSIRRADAGLGTSDHDANQALSPDIGVTVHVEANHG